jgi:hypothetical protein
VAAAQPGYGGALLGLRRTKASGARSSGREGGGHWAGVPGRWVEVLGEVGRSEGVGPAEPDLRRIFKGKIGFRISRIS